MLLWRCAAAMRCPAGFRLLAVVLASVIMLRVEVAIELLRFVHGGALSLATVQHTAYYAIEF
jgi:hypothetical protein